MKVAKQNKVIKTEWKRKDGMGCFTGLALFALRSIFFILLFWSEACRMCFCFFLIFFIAFLEREEVVEGERERERETSTGFRLNPP